MEERKEEFRKILKNSKDNVIFIADYNTAIGIQAAINQNKEKPEPNTTIGIKTVADIEILESILKEVIDNKELLTYHIVLAFDEQQQDFNVFNVKIKKLLEELKTKCIPYPLELMRKKGLVTAISNIIKTLTNNDEVTEINKSLKDINAFEQKESFFNSLNKHTKSKAIKTGFNEFDMALGGGLRPSRLYGIGAITSLGKTTFVLQVADNIAKEGQDVLIFSLEMGRYELMAKSLSRETYKYCKDNDKEKSSASSLQDILDFDVLSKENKNIFEKAMINYENNIAKHINISEGVGEIGVKQIRKLVETFCIFKNSNPVVIIDYLQIVSPFNDRLNDKQNIDKNVLELKRICRDYQIPVIVINSFNRANYLNEVSFESFKESGAIEYSCDVLIALQLCIPNRENWDKSTTESQKRKEVNDAKIANPRIIEAIILKNRGYKAYVKTNFQYFPEYDYFVEYEYEF
jgi:replicative DNA helicase